MLAVLLSSERSRLKRGPLEAVLRARKRGALRKRRSEIERRCLRRAIFWVDRFVPPGPNCYRRALIEISLDAGAAAEPLMMGFQSGGAAGSGHAWLPSSPPAKTYDAVIPV